MTFGCPEPVASLRASGIGRTDEERVADGLRQCLIALGAIRVALSGYPPSLITLPILSAVLANKPAVQQSRSLICINAEHARLHHSRSDGWRT